MTTQTYTAYCPRCRETRPMRNTFKGAYPHPQSGRPQACVKGRCLACNGNVIRLQGHATEALPSLETTLPPAPVRDRADGWLGSQRGVLLRACAKCGGDLLRDPQDGDWGCLQCGKTVRIPARRAS